MGIVITITMLYMLLYIALSIPFVQNIIKDTAQNELSLFLDTKVEIGELQISPFNSVVIKDVVVYDQENKEAVNIYRLGAGINLWRLFWHQKLDFTHAELVGLNASISQHTADAPLNIQFIIDAFKPKDKNKPPTKFEFTIRHVVIRKSGATFDKEWIARGAQNKLDFNHINVYDFNADLSVPGIKNDDFDIDVRRITFKEKSGLNVEGISCQLHVTPQLLEVKNFSLRLPNSEIHTSDIALNAISNYKFIETIKEQYHTFNIYNSSITPSDLSAFEPKLTAFNEPIRINLSAGGDAKEIDITNLNLYTTTSSLKLKLNGNVANPTSKENIKAEFNEFELGVNSNLISKILGLAPNLNANVAGIISRCGSIEISAPLSFTPSTIVSKADIATALGSLLLDVDLSGINTKNIQGDIALNAPNFNLGTLLNNQKLGDISINTTVSLNLVGKEIFGTADASIPYVDFNGNRINNVKLNATKEDNDVAVVFDIDDDKAIAHVQGKLSKDGNYSNLVVDSNIDKFEFALINAGNSLNGYTISGDFSANISGSNIDDVTGHINCYEVWIKNKENHNLYVGDVILSSNNWDGKRAITLNNQYISGEVDGDFNITSTVSMVKGLLTEAFPAFINAGNPIAGKDGEYANLNLTIHKSPVLTEYFNLPYTMLTDINISGNIDHTTQSMVANINCPYIQQGKNKLIRDTKVSLDFSKPDDNYSVTATTTMPSKSNEITLDLDLKALNNKASVNFGWLVHREGSFKGNISLDALLNKSALTGKPTASVDINPTTFDINDTTWYISKASIDYADKRVRADGVRVHSGNQFVDISGIASSTDTDTLKIQLQEMNLDYVFGTLGINYVNFGGNATGNLYATSVFASTPRAFTPSLKVKGFTYNGGLLGDADIRSYWDNENKKVAIHSDITEGDNLAAIIDGGIWVTRDSLAFNLDASKVNVKFLEPFMSAFTSEVNGRASGTACLYGTFKDIDLIAKLKADTINMKIDFTNTYYGGSDSINIYPGKIDIKDFTLYDREGNTAKLNGWVRHRYFHEPSFSFNITNARNLLCYNTNPTINPDWYGTIYGNGSASITGHPGIVDILVDMQTAPRSVFTFVLSDQETAYDYDFLTFTNKRKEALVVEQVDTVPDIIKLFQKKQSEEQSSSSQFNMDIRATVTPQAEMIIVMDPIAGDKIRAFGSGSMQMGYGSQDEKLTMYGKYTLDKGSYNFSLQDLILRTFNIREGSSISFNGDPYQANLNIDALYRVNTNLSDLDKSFSTDKDLNRTNVPVDAVLKVYGDMQSPEISFDIELPTLTQDVTRKVKSIVSTEDMMNRQIVYLLALNRFYTPEYMGGGSNNELVSIASTTLSSHLSNILGQISDNWSFSPNIRSDNGDFSDMEIDLALSSQLLNNRLLLNGNFGYRDRTTSSTTFIGDFDLEYLLNKRGSFRLKAYNHYNDQNYYLKSALTTQGIGVVYKHDFTRWFNFLRKRRKKE
jgi:hypothetical protein